MRNFRFGLEKVLEIRKYRERETEIELGRAVGELSRIERQISALGSEREAAGKFSRDDAAQILVFDRYVRRLDAERERALEDAAEAERVVEQARGVYLEASRDRKVLDKLRERQAQEHRKARLAEETKATDDISSRIRLTKSAVLVEGRSCAYRSAVTEVLDVTALHSKCPDNDRRYVD
jgi:flagellar FliJ protein